jgi:hypothetical protein
LQFFALGQVEKENLIEHGKVEIWDYYGEEA